MHRLHRGIQQGAARQGGTTLILALVLVLLATLMALFAMNVGIFEQRAATNDVRSRLVQQTAEAAIAQGIEYINLNSPAAIDTTDATKWEICPDDDSFPCGAVEKCAYGNATCTTTMQRRGNMYRFIGGGTYDVNGDGDTNDVMDVRSLPLDRQMATVGNGYGVNYGVGAVLCIVKTPALPTDPTQCTTDLNQASGTVVVTLVSTANISGESAKTTISTTIGRSGTLFAAAKKPPVVASGTITTNGNFQIVTNPNAGGTGVPVSMWTRMAVDKTGTPNTCYMDSFLHGGSPAYEGSSPPIPVCDSCNCPSGDSLSFPKSGNKSQQGIDIVDVDPATPQCTTTVTDACKPNLDIRPGEFPCDLFQYVFGDSAWTDTDNDQFCETRKLVQVTSTNGHNYTIGEDENYLLSKATYIIKNNGTPYAADLANMTSATIVSGCSILASTTSGMIWDQTGCKIQGQVGSADAPVVLVSDGDIQMNAGGRLFGLLFVRPNIYGPSTGPLDPTTGATANNGGNLQENGHAVIYGSVVIQGTANKINGTGAVVYSDTVLSKLANEAALNKIGPVPGSWSDRYAY